LQQDDWASVKPDMTNHRIFKQAGLSTMITGLGLATSVVRVIFLTHSLSVNDYGVLSVLQTTMMALSYLFPLGAFQYVYKETASRGLPILAVKSVAVGVGITSFLWTLAGTLLARLLLSSDALGFSLLEWELTLAASGLSAILFVLTYYLYGQRQVVFYNFLLFLRGYGWLYILVPLVLLFKARLTVIWVLASWVVLTAIALVQAIRRIGFSRLLEAPIDMSWFRFSVEYGAPLLPFFLSVWGVLAISKYILTYVCDSVQVALFSLAYTVLDMIYLVAVSVSQTLSPYIFADWEGEKQSSFYFDAAIKYSILLTTLLTMETLLVGRQVIQLLAGKTYTGASALIPLMSPLPLLRVLSANVQQRLMATNRTRQMGIIYVIGLLCTLVVGLWWGQLWGVYGVIASLLFTQILLLATMAWEVRGEIKLDSKFFPFSRILISSIALAFFIWLGMTMSLPWQSLFVLAIAMPGVYFAILYECKAISQLEIAYVRLGFSQLAAQMIKRLRPYRE
jgi:O-antigen/teichoic acid export membrane protein